MTHKISLCRNISVKKSWFTQSSIIMGRTRCFFRKLLQFIHVCNQLVLTNHVYYRCLKCLISYCFSNLQMQMVFSFLVKDTGDSRAVWPVSGRGWMQSRNVWRSDQCSYNSFCLHFFSVCSWPDDMEMIGIDTCFYCFASVSSTVSTEQRIHDVWFFYSFFVLKIPGKETIYKENGCYIVVLRRWHALSHGEFRRQDERWRLPITQQRFTIKSIKF